MTVRFVVPRPSVPSGGHAYNAAVSAHWPGSPLTRVEIDGPWPCGDTSSREALRSALDSSDVVLLDGLVGAASPDLIEAASRRGVRIVLLVHLPLAAEGGLADAERLELAELEERSVRAAWRVVATSRTAADELARRTGRADIAAVPPGVQAAPIAEPHDPPGLVQVGSIGPRKNQLGTVAALTECRDLPWTATFVGPVADPAYAERFRAALDGVQSGWVGPLQGAALDDAYAAADLLLHPARAETWGMVVTEALARGIPAIVGAGTGAVEALSSGATDGLPGAAVPVEEPGVLARHLRRWLTDPALRREWRERALESRRGLRNWPRAAAELAGVVRQ